MYTETELQSLIKSVEAEFSAHLSLAKSEEAPEKEEPKDEPKHEEKEEHKEESKDEGHDKAEGEKSEAPEHKEESEKPEHKEEGEKEEAEGEEKHEEPKAEGDDEGHDYDEEDMEHMHKMYGSMKKGELKAHHDCIKKCLDAHKEGPAMEKSEVTAAIEIPAVNVEEVALLKSEVEAERAKSTDLQKSLDKVTEILTAMVKKSAPAGKAVTSMEVIAKSEITQAEDVKSLSKSEITARLSKKAADPSLAKSDRQAINAYFSTYNLESISHLLK